MTLLNQLMQSLGVLGASSFALIATGDFVTQVGSTLVTKVIAPLDTPFAKKVVFYWGVVLDLYEETRTFLDRLSVYSRPRTPPYLETTWPTLDLHAPTISR